MTLLIVGALLAVAAIALAVYVKSLGFSSSLSYEAADENPLMGFAARADNPDAAASEQLVYIDVTWADWEPEEGEFDTAGLERRMHVDEYRKQGKHAVLRFVCDVPGDERLVQAIPCESVPNYEQLPVGQTVYFRNPAGYPMPALVQKIEDGKVYLDFNHNLAGKALTFELELVSREEAPESCGCGGSCDSCGGGCGSCH